LSFLNGLSGFGTTLGADAGAAAQADAVKAAPSLLNNAPPPATPDAAAVPGAAPKASGDAGAQAADLIKGFEGYRPDAYWDVNAHRVGYGSDTTTDPATGAVAPVTAATSGVSQEAAEADLRRRIQTQFIPAATKAIGTDAWDKLPPPAQAAITSVAYNYGHVPAPVAEAAQTGDPRAVGDAIASLAGANNGVNAGRRMQEAALARGQGG
jgi:GH24 family phage-related lysozyme (muramidase)